MTTDMSDNPPGDIQPTSDNEDGSARNALSTPPRPTQSRSIQEEIESQICIPLQTPIIRAGPKLRRSKTPMSGFTIRRSERITRKPRAAKSTNVLVKKLGIAVDSNAMDAKIVEKFQVTFSNLSAKKQEALKLLFGGEFDPVALNLDLDGYDDEDI